jgi:hypothetical protein
MSFNALVSAVIAQDGTYRALLVEEEEKRKRDLSEPSDDSTEGAPLKYRRSTLHRWASYEFHLHLHHHSWITTCLSSRCYPQHLSSLLSLYYLVHHSRRLL